MKLDQGVIRLSIILISLIVFVPGTVHPQTEGGIGSGNPNTSAAAFYYVSKSGELTMQVNIWGAVQRPGRYEVPTSTDLVQLVSYAGGPNIDAAIDDVRITRLNKKEKDVIKSEYYVDLEKLSTTEESKLELNPGDTIFIDHRAGWSTVRDVITIVTTAAIITSAIANVIIAKERFK